MEIQLPKSTISYWSSVRKQEGIECTVDQLTFKLAYQLHLVSFGDSLIRRPRADWRMSTCEGGVVNIKGYTCIKSMPMVEIVSHMIIM